MSKSAVVAWRETGEELEGRYRAARDVEQRKRLSALWRVRAGADSSAAGTGSSPPSTPSRPLTRQPHDGSV
jgi:hypothetical protein